MQRADCFGILRRIPIENYDITFLITEEHFMTMHKNKLIDFICDFVKESYAELNMLKLEMNSKTRLFINEMSTIKHSLIN